MHDLDVLINDLEQQFVINSHESTSKGMMQYMKNLFPFLGLKKPLRSEIEKPFITECKKLSYNDLEYISKALWKKEAREFQYTALLLLRDSKIWKYEQSLALLEWMLVNKSWWDSVDAIAVQMVGPYFLNHPAKRNKKIEEWKNSTNMWLNRTAILFQLKYKEKTDIELLLTLIIHFASEKEFFIRKALGWALRELSYLHPQLVIDFCNSQPLQTLSKTEALTALKRNGKI